MKLVTWLASSSEAIFGTLPTVENPTGTLTNVNIKPIGHKEDTSEYIGLSFEVVTPAGCTEITAVPADTFYNIFNGALGYFVTDAMVRTIALEMRTAETQRIYVEVDGIKLDGDETSQERMARTLLVIGETGTFEGWTDYNNVPQTLTGLQFKQALGLAGQAQSVLWRKYSL